MLKLKYAVTTNMDRMISRLTAHCLFSSMRLTKVVKNKHNCNNASYYIGLVCNCKDQSSRYNAIGDERNNENVLVGESHSGSYLTKLLISLETCGNCSITSSGST